MKKRKQLGRVTVIAVSTALMQPHQELPLWQRQKVSQLKFPIYV